MSYQKIIEIGLSNKSITLAFNKKHNPDQIEQLMINALRIIIGQNAINKQRNADKGAGIISPHNGKPILKS